MSVSPPAAADLASVESLVALLTLTGLEIVLGIDNIVFIAIVTGRLPRNRQALARRLGLGLAMVMRILLLLTLNWIMGLTRPLLTLAGNEFSGRDLIMLLGGVFLIGKATYEIHERIEGPEPAGLDSAAAPHATLGSVLIWIITLDIVFSLDSVITAVGMARHLIVMIAAIIFAVGIMMVFAEVVSRFIENYPTFKILALSFMLLVGVMLIVEGFGKHVDKGYIYFAMSFSLGVEILNIKAQKGRPSKPSAGPPPPSPVQPSPDLPGA
ncbi:MAG: TerC family protein [Candidatus Sumerlaeia bacterium]